MLPLALQEHLKEVQPESELDFLLTPMETLEQYQSLVSRPLLPSTALSLLAEHASGLGLSHSAADGPIQLRCWRSFFARMDLAPLHVSQAALHLASACSELTDAPDAIKLLVTHPACTPESLVLALWSLFSRYGPLVAEYATYTAPWVDDYLAALAALAVNPLACTALALTHSLVKERIPAGDFLHLTSHFHQLLADSPDGAEIVLALIDEWSGDLSSLYEAASLL